MTRNENWKGVVHLGHPKENGASEWDRWSHGGIPATHSS